MTLSREPLVIRTAIVAAVTALLHTLVILGIIPIDASQEAAAAGAIDLIGTAIAVVWSRAAVTPVVEHEPRHAAPDEPAEPAPVEAAEPVVATDYPVLPADTDVE